MSLVLDYNVILKHLNREKDFYRISNGNLMIRCPFPHDFKPSGAPIYGDGTTLGISLTDGKWQCFSRCGSKSLDLRDLFSRLGLPPPPFIPRMRDDASRAVVRKIEPWMRDAVAQNRDVALQYWRGRGIAISDDLAEEYGLGADIFGKTFHVRFENRFDGFVGWASRSLEDSIKWIIQPEGVDKSKTLFGKILFGSTFAVVTESIPDVLKLNTFRLNAFSTNGVEPFPRMVEQILAAVPEICLVPHNDEAGVSWLKKCAHLFRNRISVMSYFSLPSSINDTAEFPGTEAEYYQLLSLRSYV